MGLRSQVEMLLGLVFIAGIIFLIAFGASRPEPRMARLDAMASARAISTGAEHYEANCRSCHGINGEGVGELGPALNDRSFFRDRLDTIGWQGTLAEYARASIALGRIAATRPLYAGDGNVVMTPWEQQYGGPLRPDEIDDLVAFIMNWKQVATGEIALQPLATPTPSAEDLAARAGAGNELFVSAGCATCHTIAGLAEGQGGPDLSQVAAAADSRRPGYTAEAYLRESFLSPNAFRVEGYGEEVVCGGVLTQTQLDDLISFLMSRR